MSLLQLGINSLSLARLPMPEEYEAMAKGQGSMAAKRYVGGVGPAPKQRRKGGAVAGKRSATTADLEAEEAESGREGNREHGRG